MIIYILFLTMSTYNCIIRIKVQVVSQLKTKFKRFITKLRRVGFKMQQLVNQDV